VTGNTPISFQKRAFLTGKKPFWEFVGGPFFGLGHQGQPFWDIWFTTPGFPGNGTHTVSQGQKKLLTFLIGPNPKTPGLKRATNLLPRARFPFFHHHGTTGFYPFFPPFLGGFGLELFFISQGTPFFKPHLGRKLYVLDWDTGTQKPGQVGEEPLFGVATGSDFGAPKRPRGTQARFSSQRGMGALETTSGF